MVHDLLIKLGLGDKEITVYLAILQKGGLSATQIAQNTKINRTTVYSVLKELIAKGLLNEDISKTPSLFVPLPPQDLNNLIIAEEQKIRHRKNLIDQLIPELLSISQTTIYSPPKIKFVAEDNIDAHLRSQAPIWAKSVLSYDGVFWGFQDPTFVENYQSFIDWQWENVAKFNSMKFHFISEKSEIETKMVEKKMDRRIIRYWDKASHFTASTWAVGDFLVLVMTRERPHYLIEINDKILAHNMRELFKGLWMEIESSP